MDVELELCFRDTRRTMCRNMFVYVVLLLVIVQELIILYFFVTLGYYLL